jgi:hypothetical protein
MRGARGVTLLHHLRIEEDRPTTVQAIGDSHDGASSSGGACRLRARTRLAHSGVAQSASVIVLRTRLCRCGSFSSATSGRPRPYLPRAELPAFLELPRARPNPGELMTRWPRRTTSRARLNRSLRGTTVARWGTPWGAVALPLRGGGVNSAGQAGGAASWGKWRSPRRSPARDITLGTRPSIRQ